MVGILGRYLYRDNDMIDAYYGISPSDCLYTDNPMTTPCRPKIVLVMWGGATLLPRTLPGIREVRSLALCMAT